MNTKKIKHILLDKNIRQKDIAEACGVSEAFVSLVINGKRKPTATLLKILTEYLRVSADELTNKTQKECLL